jgi:Na+/melibiose symporter-like transporter
MNMASGEKLRVGTKLGFGVGSVAEGAIMIAFNTWNFLFYNQVCGLSGTLAGLAVTISLVLDAIADPVVGSISDRWRSKLGRRHPFLYASALPLAASFYFLYMPPAGLSNFSLFLWFTMFATLNRQALTLYQVPHLALGAELSHDYHQRSAIMSYASLFGLVGGASTFFFGWTWFSKIPGAATVRSGYPALGATVGIFAAVAILLSAHFTRDQIPRLLQPTGTAERFGIKRMWQEIAECLANRNYRVMLLGLFCVSGTIGTKETVNSYTNLFFWELPPEKIRLFALASPPAYVIAFIATVWLHRRIDKRNSMMLSLALIVLGGCVPVIGRLLGVVPPNNTPALMSVLFCATFTFYLGFATLTISALSALADIADEHELATGRRREGVFFAARTFFAKLSSGVGHIVAGVAMDLIAFPHGARPGQVAQDVVRSLGVLDGPVAVVPALLSIYFYAKYRIDHRMHSEIQTALAERRRRTVSLPTSENDGAMTGAERTAV